MVSRRGFAASALLGAGAALLGGCSLNGVMPGSSPIELPVVNEARLAANQGASAAARVLLAPLIRVVRAVPVASFILILLVWCRNAAVPVWIAALMVAPTVWAGVDKGLHEVDGQLLEMGRVFGFSFWKRLREIELPSVLPYFLSSVSASLGLAWKAGVAAEVLCTPADSIGKKIYEAKVYLETPELFAWTVVVVLISMALEALILWALSRLPGGRNVP